MRARVGCLVRSLFAVAFIVMGAGIASAHETTRSYVTLSREGTAVFVDFRLAFRDVEVVAWIDEDLDGRITWGEARRRLDVIETYVRRGFLLDAGGPCALSLDGAGASRSGGIEYLDIDFVGYCPDGSAPLAARSRLFTEIDPDHRMFLTSSIGGATTTTTLSRSEPSVQLTGDTGGPLNSLVSYFRAGVEHLLGGADHVVFLILLMLPAVCAAQGQARKAALGVVAPPTRRTMAHALTLTAATTEMLRPPSGVIEALIALSIVITAADNVRPFVPVPRAAVASFFGLVHGFGFATALGALELTGGGLAVALIGFNLGIEAAQIGVVLVTMPALYMLGGGQTLLWLGSAGGGAIGLWWLWSRLAPLASALQAG